MDTLVEAAARLAGSGRHPQLVVAIAGTGRERTRLERLIHRTGAPVHLLGRVPSPDLPALYACADVFALCCRSRWGGLEQEGFGIVFLEAAASGIPAVAGDTGGAAEAVVDGETGIVLPNPPDVTAVAGAIHRLLSDPAAREPAGPGRPAPGRDPVRLRRARQGSRGRRRRYRGRRHPLIVAAAPPWLPWRRPGRRMLGPSAFVVAFGYA